MKNFIRDNFRNDGEYLKYDNRFVGRFKSGRPITKAEFKRELIKNHDVDTYFERLSNGESPLGILKEDNKKWYIDTMNKYYIKRIGRPVYNEDGSHVEVA